MSFLGKSKSWRCPKRIEGAKSKGRRENKLRRRKEERKEQQ